MSFYIHLKDPTFWEEPWPGERRLGPYNTAEEAIEQAAHDLARGALTMESFVGIFLEDAPAVANEDVHVRAADLRVDLAKEHAADVAAATERIEALSALLPEGVTVGDLLVAARA